MNTSRLLNIIFFLLNFLVASEFLLHGRSPQLANPAVTTLFYLGLIFLEKRTSFRLRNYIRVLLIITLISHSLIGEFLRYYYKTAYFDKSLHAFGCFAFALFAFELLDFHLKIYSNRPGLFIFILVSLLGITLGTFFELAEFSLDRLLREKNQFGLIDTDLDLMFDVIGSMLAGLYLIFRKHFLKNPIRN